MTTSLADLGTGKYISVTTYRRDATPVATAVWFAVDGPDLVIFTPVDSGKVKRIRHTPRVTVSPCDVRGRIPEGAPVIEGIAAVTVGPDETLRAQRLVMRRYAVLGRLMPLVSRIRRGPEYVGVRISPLAA